MLPLRLSGSGAGGSIADIHLRSDRWLASVALVLLAVPAAWFLPANIRVLESETQFVGLRVLIRLLMLALPIAGLIAVTVSTSRRS